jgi:epoxyqueuosine reductase
VKDRVKARAFELGFDDCRITTADPPETAPAFEGWLQDGRHGAMGYLERNAFKRVDPRQVLPGARSIIVLAASYARPSAEPEEAPAGAGIIARYAQHRDYHDVLGERLKRLSDFVGELSGPETRSLWYIDTGPMLERDLAQRAGIGFAGKHTNLISRSLGNFFFLAEIITTVDLPPDHPEKNRCGSCSRCITACPTDAIIAPFKLDARRCISYLTIELKGSIPEEFRPAIGNRVYGCDICLEACPWNRFAREGRVMREHRREDLRQPMLLELLALDDAAFKIRFAGTPMLRTKRRGLLRNVCVALGNVGDENALAALERAAADQEPLIVEHARWAIEQIIRRTIARGELAGVLPPTTE